MPSHVGLALLDVPLSRIFLRCLTHLDWNSGAFSDSLGVADCLVISVRAHLILRSLHGHLVDIHILASRRDRILRLSV